MSRRWGDLLEESEARVDGVGLAELAWLATRLSGLQALPAHTPSNDWDPDADTEEVTEVLHLERRTTR